MPPKAVLQGIYDKDLQSRKLTTQRHKDPFRFATQSLIGLCE